MRSLKTLNKEFFHEYKPPSWIKGKIDEKFIPKSRLKLSHTPTPIQRWSLPDVPENFKDFFIFSYILLVQYTSKFLFYGAKNQIKIVRVQIFSYIFLVQHTSKFLFYGAKNQIKKIRV